MEKMEIGSLIDNCVVYFKSANYTQYRIDKYRSLWRRGILLYMRARSLTLYTPEVGKGNINESFLEKQVFTLQASMHEMKNYLCKVEK